MSTAESSPQIIAADTHGLDRSQLPDNALKVLSRLNEAGHEAYLVGGCLRDLLAGLEPKDFDVATSATPEEVKGLFRNCRLIGRRFRLAHVLFGYEIIEVATFRGSGDDSQSSAPAETEQRRYKRGEVEPDRHEVCEDSGRILRDNQFGSIAEDAHRRDFTINALYYGIQDEAIVDYVDAMADVQNRRVRLIGDPEQRYREDPVRLLRAVRFAVKLGYDIDGPTAAPIRELASLLADIPAARLFEEFLKLFHSGRAEATFDALHEYGLLEHLFPDACATFRGDDEFPLNFIRHALRNTDDRVAKGMPVTPAFLLAVFLWAPVRYRADSMVMDEGQSPAMAMQQAIPEIVGRQLQRLSIPKRFRFPMQDIWTLQLRLRRRGGRRSPQLVEHPRFRAAYDFLALRAAAGEAEQELVDWWTEFQKVNADEQESLLREARTKNPTRRRRRRRRGGSGATEA